MQNWRRSDGVLKFKESSSSSLGPMEGIFLEKGCEGSCNDAIAADELLIIAC